MHNCYNIRALAKNDWQSFREMRLEALQNYPHVFYGSYQEEVQQEQLYWQAIFDEKDSCIFGAFYDADLIGIAVVSSLDDSTNVPSHQETVGCLGSIYVKPEHQRSDVGSQLGKACIEWSINCTLWTRLFVACRASNEASRRLILHLGLSSFETIKNKKYPNGDVEDEDWYRIDLNEARSLRPSQAVSEAILPRKPTI